MMKLSRLKACVFLSVRHVRFQAIGIHFVYLFFVLVTSGLPAYAIEMRSHPIYDLIEGDKRTPPEEENIVEERPATPAYPLPSTRKFSQETAVETFPEQTREQVDTRSRAEDEWDEWSSWDEWTDMESWDDWDLEPNDANSTPSKGESGTEKKPSGKEELESKSFSSLEEGAEWDEWFEKTDSKEAE